MNFIIKDSFVKITINAKLYDFESIYSTSYQMTEDSYIYFYGDSENEIIVNLSYKDNSKNKEKELLILAKDFLNNLVNYTYYKVNSKKKKLLRALLLKKIFQNVQ